MAITSPPGGVLGGNPHFLKLSSKANKVKATHVEREVRKGLTAQRIVIKILSDSDKI